MTSIRKRVGYKELHKTLTSSTNRLIKNHTEMFGKWKESSNTVAKKLAVALYYMMLTGLEFSYKNYRLVKNLTVFNIPIA